MREIHAQPKKHQHSLVLLALALGLFPRLSVAQSVCDSILQYGLTDERRIESSEIDDFLNDGWLCNEESDDTLTKTGASASIELLDLIPGVSGAYNKDELHAWRSKKCSSVSTKKFSSRTSSLFEKIASPTVVNAWAECVKASKSFSGVIDIENLDDDTFILSYSYTPQYTGQPSPKVSSLLIKGARCSGNIEVGSELPPPGSPLKLICEREVGAFGEKAKVLIAPLTSFSNVPIYFRPYVPPVRSCSLKNSATVQTGSSMMVGSCIIKHGSLVPFNFVGSYDSNKSTPWSFLNAQVYFNKTHVANIYLKPTASSSDFSFSGTLDTTGMDENLPINVEILVDECKYSEIHTEPGKSFDLGCQPTITVKGTVGQP